jgi:hypothetical protein
MSFSPALLREGRSIFWEVIVSVILSKKLYKNVCPIPNGFRDGAIWLYSGLAWGPSIVHPSRPAVLCLKSNGSISETVRKRTHVHIKFLLRMTDTMTSQNIVLSSWDTLYNAYNSNWKVSLISYQHCKNWWMRILPSTNMPWHKGQYLKLYKEIPTRIVAADRS